MGVIRVLLIEDDQSYARLIQRMLELSPVGFVVTVANTLKAAKCSLDESRFNLILTDLNLPDTKGLDTIEEVRSAALGIPLVVLTGVEEVDLKPRALSRGAQFCLCKSEIDTKSLLNAMHQAVRISREIAVPLNDARVNEFVAQFEEDIVVLQEALGILEDEQPDTRQLEACQMIRSRIGKMHQRIGTFQQRTR